MTRFPPAALALGLLASGCGLSSDRWSLPDLAFETEAVPNDEATLAAIALDGTQEIWLGDGSGHGRYVGWRIVSDPDHVTATLPDDHGTVVLAGIAIGETSVVARSHGGLIDKQVAEAIVSVLAVDTITFVPAEQTEWLPPAAPVAFVAGTRHVGVALWGEQRRLVDRSMWILAGSGGTSGEIWTELQPLSPGTRSLTVRHGNALDQQLTLTTVDHLDRIEVIDETTGETNVRVCFAARTGDLFVAHEEWAFEIDGSAVAADSDYANCVRAPSDASSVIARAGGLSAAWR